jgi:hypothetical protein
MSIMTCKNQTVPVFTRVRGQRVYVHKGDTRKTRLPTAEKSGDGSVTIQFGGCDGKTANCLPILKGWIYTVRLYRPRAEILNGAWTFPEAQPVN